MTSVAWQASLIVAPVLSGFLYVGGTTWPFIAAVVFAIIAVFVTFLIKVQWGRVGVKTHEEPASLHTALEGLRLIRRTPILLGAISLDLFAVLFGGAVALLPIFARDVLEVGPAGLGVLRAAPAVGALCAAFVLAHRPVRRHAGRTLLIVVALYGVTIVVFGLSETMWVSLAALAAGGAVDTVSVVLRQTILPLVTPDELRGRVTAVEMVFISASNELGAFESGVAAALMGAVPAVIVGGVVTIGVALTWTRLFPQLAKVDRLDELRPVEIAA
jgi:Transmembrane secretion effector